MGGPPCIRLERGSGDITGLIPAEVSADQRVGSVASVAQHIRGRAMLKFASDDTCAPRWLRAILTHWGFPSGSVVTNPPAVQKLPETGLYPSQEGPLEEGMVTHSSILAWRIPRTEEPGRLQSIESQSWT